VIEICPSLAPAFVNLAVQETVMGPIGLATGSDVDKTGLRPKKPVLVLVLQVWCCVVKHGLVTLIVIMILKDTASFQVLFIVSLFCTWNITTVEINSGVHLLIS